MEGWTYKKAGVDLDAHRAMHDEALEAVVETASRCGMKLGGLGGYAAWAELWGKRVALHVDGVGTKTLVLERLGRLWVAGWDCVAMNVNDLAVAGFKPLLMVDYVAMPRSDPEGFREVLRGVREAAVRSGVALVGGETAILPGLAGGYDVVCTVLGVAVEAGYEGKARPGDVLVGVESNGLHANGYSLARRVVEEKLGGYDVEYGGVRIGEELARPTHIYSNLVLEAIRRGLASAAAHVTGGGFTKLARILRGDSYIEVEPPEPPAVFRVLQELGGIPVEEMYRVFNMGVGLVLAAEPGAAEELVKLAGSHGFRAWVIGRVRRGSPRVVVKPPGGGVVEYKVRPAGAA
ncbi:phosphoribosylformylglycinamidine cyclo-ligase [Stetteria hydrogenophila]